MTTNTQPKECWSVDEETFHCDNLSDLIDQHALEVDCGVYVGEAVTPTVQQLIGVDDIFEAMGERAYDLCGEWADDYPDVSPDARKELEDFIGAWFEKHCKPSFYMVKNVRPYTVTADDMDGSE